MSLDVRKTDPVLGKAVHQHLVKMGVETPLLLKTGKSNEQKIIQIQKHFSSIMDLLGLDRRDDSLAETPRRVAKMFVQETLWGLDYANFPKMMEVDNKMQYKGMVNCRKINVTTLCEHHWQNIVGKVHIAYVPNGKVTGLSKFNRIVEFFCRRPQVQERLTEQIYHALSFILKTPHVAVCMVAEHHCVRARGVEDHESDTVTTKLGGVYETESDVRYEFYTMLKL